MKWYFITDVTLTVFIPDIFYLFSFNLASLTAASIMQVYVTFLTDDNNNNKNFPFTH